MLGPEPEQSMDSEYLRGLSRARGVMCFELAIVRLIKLVKQIRSIRLARPTGPSRLARVTWEEPAIGPVISNRPMED